MFIAYIVSINLISGLFLLRKINTALPSLIVLFIPCIIIVSAQKRPLNFYRYFLFGFVFASLTLGSRARDGRYLYRGQGSNPSRDESTGQVEYTPAGSLTRGVTFTCNKPN